MSDKPLTPEEAVFAALTMYQQGKPRAFAARQFTRWLEQDGFTVVDAARPADPGRLLWHDIVKFVRWSANVRDDTPEAIAVARHLLARINAATPTEDQP